MPNKPALRLTSRPRPAAPAAARTHPTYSVPTMTDLTSPAWPRNGYKVISTFAGAGGSSTGYRLAGYQVLWANEFVEAARDTYAANKHPDTILDGRDIRTVTAEDILAATGLDKGELDLLDGSPPCASFSTAGKRSKKWGTSSKYSDTSQRTDDLFFEFVRLIDGLAPRTFVAENVSGLIKGSAKGYFKQILAAMETAGPGYRVSARLLDASWLGVPQSRQRVIFVGVRSDLTDSTTGELLQPCHPEPLPYRHTLAEVLPQVLRFGTMPPFAEWGSHRDVYRTMHDATTEPMYTIVATSPGSRPGNGLSGGIGWVETNDPPTGAVKSGGWDGTLRPTTLDRPAPTISAHGVGNNNPDTLAISDKPPPPPATLYQRDFDTEGGVRTYSDQPAPTVQSYGVGGVFHAQYGMVGVNTSAIWRDGVAYDPETDAKLSIEGTAIGTLAESLGMPTLRKFTIAELRAICSFPPDFILTGTYPQRWERLGRSVPPLMMKAVASTVATQILDRCAD